MAQNIFEQYGIKEVADVQFEALTDDDRLGVKKGDIVLYLDTLKVSTIETTGEQTEAKGGKGNVPLIIWDYGREVTLTLEDALFSPASLAVMMGGKGVEETATEGVIVRVNQELTYDATKTNLVLKYDAYGTEGQAGSDAKVRILNMTTGTRASVTAATSGLGAAILTKLGSSAGGMNCSAGDRIKLFYDVKTPTTDKAYKITIDSETFPGTYKVYGDTLVRDTNGHDTAFQFVVPKAKVGSSVTFTMQAEGDPTTFEMSLRVMRTDDHKMIELIKYDLTTKSGAGYSA